MTFKVKDLMVRVGGAGYDDEASTCTGWTRPTGSGCVDSLLFGAGRAEAGRQDLAVLRAQLRQAVARS
jgi:hypothetical protein